MAQVMHWHASANDPPGGTMPTQAVIANLRVGFKKASKALRAEPQSLPLDVDKYRLGTTVTNSVSRRNERERGSDYFISTLDIS